MDKTIFNMLNSQVLSLHALYNKIRKTYYEKYKQAEAKYNDLTNNNECWDLLSHSKEENQKYSSLIYQKNEFALIAILFAAFSVEAMINWYGVSMLGEKFFHEYLERVSLLNKLVLVTRIATGNEFPKADNTYRKVKKLNDTRNNLVHSKSKELSFEKLFKMDDNEFFEMINSILGHGKDSIYAIIDEAVTVYDDLLKLLIKLNNKEKG